MVERVGVALVALAILATGLSCGEPGRRQDSWEAMGSPVEVDVRTRTLADADEAIERIRQRIDEASVDLDPESSAGALGAINRGAGAGFHPIENGDVYRCLQLALDYARESNGAYDPSLGALRRLLERPVPARSTEIEPALSRVGWQKVILAPEAHAIRFRAIGLQLDLGMVARGCGLDWAARTFARPGSLAGLLRFDGAYRVWGAPAGEKSWEVALEDPRRSGAELLRLRVTNRGIGVAGRPSDPTSQPGARLFLDSESGLPAGTNLLVAVALADSAADAAALAHALYVAGSLGGPNFLARTRRTEAILLVRRDGDRPYLLASGSLEGTITPSPALESETAGDLRYLLPPQSLTVDKRD